MRFVLLVEGDTEKWAAAGFLKRWLDAQLGARVGVQAVGFQGYGDFVRKLVRKAHMYLDGPDGDPIIAVIGLLDLYGPSFYPAHASSADERHDWAVAHFEREVDRPKFRMFFAVHEFEAWLLSQPSLFPAAVQSALPSRVGHPERVDFDEPPSKLLDRAYMAGTRRGYKKVAYGTVLFRKLDPETVAAKCPRLKSMLEEMLHLARGAGL